MKTLLRTHRFLRLMLVVLLAGLLVVFGERLDKADATSMVTVTSCPTETTLIADIGIAGSGGTVRFSISRPCTISINPTLVIRQDLILDNNGQQVALDGRGLAQVLLVNPHVIVTLTALTIANGQAGDGGGLLAASGSTVRISNSSFTNNSAQFGSGLLAASGSTVRISKSTFANNSAQFGGGLLAASGSTLTISNSTFVNNSAQFGGGLFADSGSTMRISNSTFTNSSAQFGSGLLANANSTVRISKSTFANNSAQFGGGLLAASGSTLTISNSTFANNSAQFGGGLFADSGSTVRISNSTFANNSATSKGGGFFNRVGRLRIGQSIVANNTPGGNCSPSGSITDTGYNLSNDTSCGFTAANHSVPNTNPQLDPAGLKNNGGPTQTIALLPGSPAIDQIPSAVCLVATDQRGFPRPDNHESVCDIGAYEIG